MSMQTGTRFIVAEAAGELVGVARYREEEGAVVLDALASARAGAARSVVHAVERLAQERGLRWVRIEAAEECGVGELFPRWGYQPVARSRMQAGEGGITREWTRLVFEKRVRLLTVRPARSDDQLALAALGVDWPAASVTIIDDGGVVAGAVRTSRRGFGEGELGRPVIAESHRGRNLEAWLAEVAARSAATNGMALLHARSEEWPQDLLARGWREEPGGYVRELGNLVTFE
jgi:hypothetical protein